MRGTDTVTVFNTIKDNRGNITDWKSTVLNNVHFERCTAVPTNTTARDYQRDSLLLIWKEAVTAAGLQCVSKPVLSASEDKTGLFSLDTGEYVVPGVCTDIPQAGESFSVFKRTHDVLQITAVEPCLYGSPYLQHWEVTFG